MQSGGRPIKQSYTHRYPKEPSYSESCPINVGYKTLPDYWPRKEEVAGPTSIKHLYGPPKSYGYQRKVVPVGTMYQADLGKVNEGGDVEFRHFQAYPFTHRYVKEHDDYLDRIVKVPNIRKGL